MQTHGKHGEGLTKAILEFHCVKLHITSDKTAIYSDEKSNVKPHEFYSANSMQNLYITSTQHLFTQQMSCQLFDYKGHLTNNDQCLFLDFH